MIVEAISKIILKYQTPEVTEIDNGYYQGCSVFVIVDKSEVYYNPEDYIITHNFYGSCSGCDTLMGIINYEYEESLPKNRLTI